MKPRPREDKDFDSMQASFASFEFASNHNNSPSINILGIDWASLLDKTNALIDPRRALSQEVLAIIEKSKPLSEQLDFMNSPSYVFQILFVLAIHIRYMAAKTYYPDILKTDKFSEMIQAGNRILKEHIFKLSGIIYGNLTEMRKLPVYQQFPVYLQRYLASVDLQEFKKYFSDHFITEDVYKLFQLRIELQAKYVVDEVIKNLNFKVPRSNVSDYWYRKHLSEAAQHFFSKLDDPKVTRAFINDLINVFHGPSSTYYNDEITSVLHGYLLHSDIDALIQSIMPDGLSSINDDEMIEIEKKEEKLIIKKTKTMSFEDELRALFLDVFKKIPYQAIPWVCNRVIVLLNEANLPAYERWDVVTTVEGSHPDMVSLIEIALRMQVKNELKNILSIISKEFSDSTKSSQNIHSLFNSEREKLKSYIPLDLNVSVPTIKITMNSFKEGNKIAQVKAMIDYECLRTGARQVNLMYPLEVTQDRECIVAIWTDKRVKDRSIISRNEPAVAKGATDGINGKLKF